jgi:hypothetical protein
MENGWMNQSLFYHALVRQMLDIFYRVEPCVREAQPWLTANSKSRLARTAALGMGSPLARRWATSSRTMAQSSE